MNMIFGSTAAFLPSEEYALYILYNPTPLLFGSTAVPNHLPVSTPRNLKAALIAYSLTTIFFLFYIYFHTFIIQHNRAFFNSRLAFSVFFCGILEAVLQQPLMEFWHNYSVVFSRIIACNFAISCCGHCLSTSYPFLT